MKNLRLLVGLTLFCFLPNLSALAAISPSTSEPGVKTETTERITFQKQRQTKKMEKRLNRLEKRMSKKANRIRKKGKIGARFGLGFVGLIVLGVGGLLIWAGLAIPFIGWLFVGIGAIVALVGLLLFFVLDSVRVNID